jgi:hypothetical protein
MNLNIKNEKTHRLVRELARVTGGEHDCRGGRGGTRPTGTGAAH